MTIILSNSCNSCLWPMMHLSLITNNIPAVLKSSTVSTGWQMMDAMKTPFVLADYKDLAEILGLGYDNLDEYKCSHERGGGGGGGGGKCFLEVGIATFCFRWHSKITVWVAFAVKASLVVPHWNYPCDGDTDLHQWLEHVRGSVKVLADTFHMI